MMERPARPPKANVPDTVKLADLPALLRSILARLDRLEADDDARLAALDKIREEQP
jgi:hypothetical protein